MKHILTTLLLTAFLIPHAARADIPATMNGAALLAVQDLPCAAQEERRRNALLPPFFEGQPAAYYNAQARFVQFSPDLTSGQFRAANKFFNAVPDHVRAFVYREGGVYVFPRRGVVEAIPALKGERSYYGDSGLYLAVERRLFVPFERGVLATDSTGRLSVLRYEPTQREPLRIINHESGHMIDDLLGDYSADSLGADGDHRLSNRPDFIAAIAADLKNLEGAGSPLPRAEVLRLGYYMPPTVGGLRDNAQRHRREVFAELWAEAQGFDNNKLSRAYPETFKIVSGLNDYLLALHAARAVTCTYHPDGRALP